MALMALQLWQLADLALPLVIMLVSQTVLMALFAYFVTFNLMGRDYEAAVIASANCGFGMGATPNAMANMEAIVTKFGPAPKAFFIVPLVGSLFIDFFNAGIITIFMNFFVK
ncbi:Sodium/glutamate symporter [bioreactor metagenome]